MVVESFKEDPVRLRGPRYLKSNGTGTVHPLPPDHRRIALIVNDKHEIHHVRERGYVESPVRIKSILRELSKLDLFRPTVPREYPEKHIRAVHEGSYIDYFRRVCSQLEAGRSVYPYVFPIRNATRPVITSYSIHYTKLYDSLLLSGGTS